MGKAKRPWIIWPTKMVRHESALKPCPPAVRGRGCAHETPIHICGRTGGHRLYFVQTGQWVCIDFELKGDRGRAKSEEGEAGADKGTAPWCPNLAPGSPKERI